MKVPRVRVFLILDKGELKYGKVLMCIFLVIFQHFMIFRRSDAIFVVSDVFGGSSENTSENKKKCRRRRPHVGKKCQRV